MNKTTLVAIIAISFIAGTVTLDAASGFTYQMIIWTVISSADKTTDSAEKSMDTVVTTIGFVGDDLGDDLKKDLDTLILNLQALRDGLECSSKTPPECGPLKDRLDTAIVTAKQLRDDAGIIAVELDAGLLPAAQQINTDIEDLSQDMDNLKSVLKDILTDLTKYTAGTGTDILE